MTTSPDDGLQEVLRNRDVVQTAHRAILTLDGRFWARWPQQPVPGHSFTTPQEMAVIMHRLAVGVGLQAQTTKIHSRDGRFPGAEQWITIVTDRNGARWGVDLTARRFAAKANLPTDLIACPMIWSATGTQKHPLLGLYI